MKLSPAFRQWLAASLILGLIASPIAQSAEKKDKSAKRMALMMQKVQQEKAEMQAQFDQEKLALQDKIKKGEEAVGSVKSGLAAANRKSRELAAELESVRQEKSALEAKQLKTESGLQQTQASLEATNKRLADLTQQYQAAQREIKDGDAQRRELLTNLSKKGQQITVCEEKNAKLYDFGVQLTKFYDKPESLRPEPFTQIKRVELENILQATRDKLDEQRVGQLSK